MVCTSCGATGFSPTAAFCPRCGASISTSPSTSPADIGFGAPLRSAHARRRNPGVELFKVLLLLGAFVGVAYHFHRPRQVLMLIAVFTALLVFYNVVYVIVARAMGMRPEVFSVYFGPDVARWVAAVSKDPRMEFEEREAEYRKVLAASDWQAKVVKLGDLYDNLGDCRHFTPRGQKKTSEKSRLYLAAVREGLPPEAQNAVKLVEARLKELESRLTA